MPRPQQLENRGTFAHPVIEDDAEQTTFPIQPRNRRPTTHDPTIKPPWKKHKSHPTPPTADWALLWPRPPSWRCPPDAGFMSGYAGCEYIEAPEVFDPEIEGLPDWVGPREKDQRLWSGIERVVVVPEVAGEGEETVRRRGVERDSDDDSDGDRNEDGEGREVKRAVYQVPHVPSLSERRSSMSTAISTPTTSTPVTTPTATPTGDHHRVKGYTVGTIISGFVLPAVSIALFALAIGLWFRQEWKKERRKNRAKEEAREWREDTEATESRLQLSDMNLEEGRAQRKDQTNVQEERWEDLPLR
jgi:hypothetical protein